MRDSHSSSGFENLVRVIETIQEQMKRDRFIGRSETRTRDALINPILRALGWDTTVVIPEYRTQRGIVDYALIEAPGMVNRPVVLIEAKRLANKLAEQNRAQALAYAKGRANVRYVGITNGDSWELYEVSPRPLRILALSILHEPARECARHLQILTRSNLIDKPVGFPVGNKRTVLERRAVQSKSPTISPRKE